LSRLSAHRRDLFLPPLVLDRTSPAPLRQQIYRQIAEAVRSGAIRNEARLPPTRTLARLLRVSRNTVLEAYDELVADGLVRGERGAGMRVIPIQNGSGPLTSMGLERVIRAASYPARIAAVSDPDGNPLYLNY